MRGDKAKISCVDSEAACDIVLVPRDVLQRRASTCIIKHCRGVDAVNDCLLLLSNTVIEGMNFSNRATARSTLRFQMHSCGVDHILSLTLSMLDGI